MMWENRAEVRAFNPHKYGGTRGKFEPTAEGVDGDLIHNFCCCSLAAVVKKRRVRDVLLSFFCPPELPNLSFSSSCHRQLARIDHFLDK